MVATYRYKTILTDELKEREIERERKIKKEKERERERKERGGNNSHSEWKLINKTSENIDKDNINALFDNHLSTDKEKLIIYDIDRN